jgi:L-alanine-DL-glutamate epimerase-like enolase superfamily enzyme
MNGMVVAQVDEVPAWLAPAVFAAAIAALGYVARLTVDAWRSWRLRRAEEFAKLLRLQAHLAASGAAFRVQRELATRLADML